MALKTIPPEPLEVRGEAIMRFGFIETEAIVDGQRVVYDPQNPLAPIPFNANGSSAVELAIVCNREEARLLSAGERDPQKAALAVLQNYNCDVVVVKCGGRGSIVCERDGTLHDVPSFKTETVWPVGSGDVFASVFAYTWACDELHPKDAAWWASRATAHYCETKAFEFGSNFPKEPQLEPLNLDIRQKKKVYLAGPFFCMSELWLVWEAYHALRGQGLDVFSPYHHVGPGLAAEIYQPDIDGLQASDLVFACVDGLDSGTIFEIGYAIAMGKPVIAFVNGESADDLKMLYGSGCKIVPDFATAIYTAYWTAYEQL